MAQLPQTGISTGLVGNTIGLGIDDIGLLCSDLQVEKVGEIWQAKVPHIRANRINKWSKWKPINTSIISLTDAVLKAANYGLSIPTLNYLQIKAYALTTLDLSDNSTQIKWGYHPPVGGELSPYNLGAFKGYNHASKSIVNTTNVETSKIVVKDVYNHAYWTIDLDRDQVAGGLSLADFNGAEYWNIGLMLIDYESDDNPIVLLKINSDNASITREITIDLSNINSSTYIMCLFLASDELGIGIPQIDYPTATQLSAINKLYYLQPLEDGMVGVGVTNRYNTPFVMWSFVGTGMIETKFKSTENYKLWTSYNYQPDIISSPTRMIWENYKYFAIEPLFTPETGLKWNLAISMYKDNVQWTDGVYKSIVGWRDIDDNMIHLEMKTVNGLMWFRFYNSSSESVEQEYESNILLSTDVNTNTLVSLSNFNGSTKRTTLSINNTPTLLATNVVDTVENPPSFSFGGDLIERLSPRGLGYRYIELIATGTF